MNAKQTGGIGVIALVVVGGILVLGGLNYYGFLFPGTNTMNTAAVGSRTTTSDGQSEGAAANAETGTTANATNEVAFTLKLGELSAAERALLKLRGIEGDEIQVTSAMVVCAEGKLGSDRVAAIRGGAALSTSEQMQLLACY